MCMHVESCWLFENCQSEQLQEGCISSVGGLSISQYEYTQVLEKLIVL